MITLDAFEFSRAFFEAGFFCLHPGFFAYIRIITCEFDWGRVNFSVL